MMIDIVLIKIRINLWRANELSDYKNRYLGWFQVPSTVQSTDIDIRYKEKLMSIYWEKGK